MAAASPSAQMVCPMMLPGSCSMSARSFMVPSPRSIFSRIFHIQGVPWRQGVHWPQLSSA